jgi:hypothetical protein
VFSLNSPVLFLASGVFYAALELAKVVIQSSKKKAAKKWPNFSDNSLHTVTSYP